VAGVSSERSEEFASRNSELRRMSEWFRDFARETGVPVSPALDFELCLNELMANVIRYAYADTGPHRIRMTIRRRADSLGATLEDDGRPFDPTSAGEADVGRQALDGLQIGGWGIPIVRAFASEIRYERRDGRNRVSIEMRV